MVALELMRRRVARETERRLAGDVLAGGARRPPGADRAAPPARAVRDRRRGRGARLRPRRSRPRRRRRWSARWPPTPARRSSPPTPAAAASCSARWSTPPTATRSTSPPTARAALARERGAGARRRQPPGAAGAPAPLLPRGPLRAGGDRLRQRRRARGRLLARPRRLHPAALDPGRRGARRSTATACSARSRRATRSTAASCCARWRPSSSRTASGSGPRREVYCHRHTLRYRMRKVEELTGRDLSRAHDRIEFWLALRARELVA